MPYKHYSWMRQLGETTKAAIQSGDLIQKVCFSPDRKASLRLIFSGKKNAGPFLWDVDGWWWFKELAAFVAYDFSPDVDALSLVSMGIIDVERADGRLILCNGFMSIDKGVSDILSRSLTMMGSSWFVPLESRMAFECAKTGIDQYIKARIEEVAIQREMRKERQEAEQQKVEQHQRERAAIIDARIDAFLVDVHSKRMDTREQCKHNWKLQRIYDFMRGKPLSYYDWTPEMIKDCDRANVEVRLERVGTECWVIPVYPEPP